MLLLGLCSGLFPARNEMVARVSCFIENLLCGLHSINREAFEALVLETFRYHQRIQQTDLYEDASLIPVQALLIQLSTSDSNDAYHSHLDEFVRWWYIRQYPIR